MSIEEQCRMALSSWYSVVPRLRQVEPQCGVCSGYVHPDLRACPGCGAARGDRLGLLQELEMMEIPTDIDSLEELRRLVALLDDEAAPPISLQWIPDMAAQGLVDLARDALESERETLRTSIMRHISGVAVESVLAMMEGLAARFAGDLTYRCTGLAGGAFDADMGVAGGWVTITHRGKRVAAIPLHSLLAAHPYPQRIPMWNTAMGFIGSNTIYIHDPTYDGGGLLLIWRDEAGNDRALSLGNRPGFLTKKAPYQFFVLIAQQLAYAASAAVALREQGVGWRAHALELGLLR